MLGSNTVCPRGRYLPESSIWLGSQQGEPLLLEKGTELERGDAILFSADIKETKLTMHGDESTLRPFGRAVYLREAPYFVLPIGLMILYNLVCSVLFEAIHALPLICSLHLAGMVLYGMPIQERKYNAYGYTSKDFFVTVASFFLAMHFGRVILCMAIDIVAKWVFLGRRKEGRYNWYV